VDSLLLIALLQAGNGLGLVHIVHIESKVVGLIHIQDLALVLHLLDGDVLGAVISGNGGIAHAQDLDALGELTIALEITQAAVHQLALQLQIILDLLGPYGLNKIVYCHNKIILSCVWHKFLPPDKQPCLFIG